jgi:hypothetical protein
VVVDPCAGDGTAVLALRNAWVSGSDPGPSWSPNRPRLVACELERERARALRAALPAPDERGLHGDAFRLVATSDLSAGGAAVLYLNPPYDHDPEHGRLEQRFLARFSGHLAAGLGVLLFLVPYRALPASAELLGAEYTGLRCWRLARPEFEAFGQVLVAGRRRARRLESAPRAVEGVLAWAGEPEWLPVLAAGLSPSFEVPPRS